MEHTKYEIAEFIYDLTKFIKNKAELYKLNKDLIIEDFIFLLKDGERFDPEWRDKLKKDSLEGRINGS